MILFAIALSARTPWAAGDIAAEGGGFRSGHMSVDSASKCSCRLLHEHLDRHSPPRYVAKLLLASRLGDLPSATIKTPREEAAGAARGTDPVPRRMKALFTFLRRYLSTSLPTAEGLRSAAPLTIAATTKPPAIFEHLGPHACKAPSVAARKRKNVGKLLQRSGAEPRRALFAFTPSG
jgi:hypothetical protein